MGVSNAFFVALSVPLSVFVAFMFLPAADLIVGTHVTLNFIVLFALLFGLGIIVDDAIVVIENTHRIFNNGKMPIVTVGKDGRRGSFCAGTVRNSYYVGAIFSFAVLAGHYRKFMIYLPTILILTLLASLIVAFLINPVFAVSFMKPEHYPDKEPKSALFRKKWFWFFVIFGVLLHLAGFHGIANFILLMVLLLYLTVLCFSDFIHRFQTKLLPRL